MSFQHTFSESFGPTFIKYVIGTYEILPMKNYIRYEQIVDG